MKLGSVVLLAAIVSSALAAELATIPYDTSNRWGKYVACPLPWNRRQIPECPEPDNYYLNRQCAIPRRQFVVSPFYQACREIWKHINIASACGSGIFRKRRYVIDSMGKGCILKEGSFVITDELAVHLQNQIFKDDLCLYKEEEPLVLEEVRGELLNHAEGDGCDPIVEDPFDEFSEDSGNPIDDSNGLAPGGEIRRKKAGDFQDLLGGKQQKSDSYCRGSCRSSSKSVKIRGCKMCCPARCFGLGAVWLRVCCQISRSTRSCNCSINNPGSHCGC